MKKHILCILLLIIGLGPVAFGQLEGKRFISGSAGLGFSNQDHKNYPSQNGYSYNFNVGLGKFKTANKTGEWTISSSLSGSKRSYDLPSQSIDETGLTGFSVGTGYDWNFYKHFSDKFGVFGGPGVALRYTYGKQIETSGDALYRKKSNEIAALFQIQAGAYYALSERWWLTASLAFSNPIYLSYSFGNSKSLSGPTEYEDSAFQYKLVPAFNFPSVGLGLRYFFRD